MDKHPANTISDKQFARFVRETGKAFGRMEPQEVMRRIKHSKNVQAAGKQGRN